ncbi:MAG TPA: aspartate kinase [Bacteroidales bacterium]|nr:aspartate kinase [Bacteroidales bacterium]
MLIFKFGGASVKDAAGVKNLAEIVKSYHDEKLVIVVSAMAKTTNALERIAGYFFNCHAELFMAYNELRRFHFEVATELFDDSTHPVFHELEKYFARLEEKLNNTPSLNFDFDYDQIVSYGEIFSTIIIAGYLNESGIKTEWTDIRKSLKTDDTYREGKVDWELSTRLIRENFTFNNIHVRLTQGFIASNINNLTTTLGREGSDYTAAILGHILEAEKIVIWKDVPGVLNADPKWFDNTELLPRLSYMDAIELAYYGASVIHPKTIQPLQHKNIALHVMSFLHPAEPGTLIGNEKYEKLIPSFIFKMDQVLIQVYPHDFSFIAEENLKTIFSCFANHNLKINLMQNSAIGFMACVNNDQTRIPGVINELRDHFAVTSENSLELVTIRYYDEKTVERVMVNKDLVLEQKSKTTIQLVVKDKG